MGITTPLGNAECFATTRTLSKIKMRSRRIHSHKVQKARQVCKAIATNKMKKYRRSSSRQGKKLSLIRVVPLISINTHVCSSTKSMTRTSPRPWRKREITLSFWLKNARIRMKMIKRHPNTWSNISGRRLRRKYLSILRKSVFWTLIKILKVETLIAFILCTKRNTTCSWRWTPTHEETLTGSCSRWVTFKWEFSIGSTSWTSHGIAISSIPKAWTSSPRLKEMTISPNSRRRTDGDTKLARTCYSYLSLTLWGSGAGIPRQMR